MFMVARAALGILILFMSVLIVHANEECSNLSGPDHFVDTADFKIARKERKSLFCTAFYCSPTFDPLQLIISNYEHHKQYTTRIYALPNTISLNKNCTQCLNQSDNCNPCPVTEESPTVEIHIRIDNPTEDNYKNETCIFPKIFNMTVLSKKFKKQCENFEVSLPTTNSCEIQANSTSNSCLSPTCSVKMENQTLDTSSFMHQFPVSQMSEICILHFQTKYKSVQIYFSPNIRSSLYIYGSSLLEPKYSFKHCRHMHRMFTVENSSESFFVLYKNEEPLNEKGFLTIKNVEMPCNYTPLLPNGTVLHMKKEGNEVLKFLCDEGFVISGSSEVICEEMPWTTVPVCVPKHEPKLISGDSKISEGNSVSFDPIPLPFEGARSPIMTHYEAPSKRLGYKKKESVNKKTWENQDYNVSVIDLDVETMETSSHADLEITSEGSGMLSIDDEVNVDFMTTRDPLSSLGNSSFNSTLDDDDDYELSLISIPSLEENFILIVSVGVGLVLILLATIFSIICCRKKCRCGSNGNRKFDTFQNPIYEKPVQVPVTVELTDHEKLNVSDVTESSHLN